MKTTILLFTIFLSGYSFTQNILEALKLKENSIAKYSPGELMPTDTIVDLKNGYYEESISNGVEEKTVLRQAAIFRNKDGSKTLGISVKEWDFQCFTYLTNFYEISKDRIIEVPISDLVPPLELRAFFVDNHTISILEKYLPKLQGAYLDSNATVDDFLNEIFEIRYIMPRNGTSLKATLGVCDYIPTNEIDISAEDWAVIQNSYRNIDLVYDKKKKIFVYLNH